MEKLIEGTPEYEEQQETHRFLLDMFLSGFITPDTILALGESTQKLGLSDPLPTSLPDQRTHWEKVIARATKDRARITEEYAEDAQRYPELAKEYADMLNLCDFQREAAEVLLQRLNSVN